ncbi:hypothetical protein [Streptomyces sp. NPDC088254]
MVWGSDGDRTGLVTDPDRQTSVTMQGQAVHRSVTISLSPVTPASRRT